MSTINNKLLEALKGWTSLRVHKLNGVDLIDANNRDEKIAIIHALEAIAEAEQQEEKQKEFNSTCDQMFGGKK